MLKSYNQNSQRLESEASPERKSRIKPAIYSRLQASNKLSESINSSLNCQLRNNLMLESNEPSRYASNTFDRVYQNPKSRFSKRKSVDEEQSGISTQGKFVTGRPVTISKTHHVAQPVTMAFHSTRPVTMGSNTLGSRPATLGLTSSLGVTSSFASRNQ